MTGRSFALALVSSLAGCGVGASSPSTLFVPGLATAYTFDTPKANGVRTDTMYGVGLLSADSDGTNVFLLVRETLAGVSDNGSDPSVPSLGITSSTRIYGAESNDGGHSFQRIDDLGFLPGEPNDPVVSFAPTVVRYAYGLTFLVGEAVPDVHCSDISCTHTGTVARLYMYSPPWRSNTNSQVVTDLSGPQTAYGTFEEEPVSFAVGPEGAGFLTKDYNGFHLMYNPLTSGSTQTESSSLAGGTDLAHQPFGNVFLPAARSRAEWSVIAPGTLGGAAMACALTQTANVALPPRAVCVPNAEVPDMAIPIQAGGVPYYVYQDSDGIAYAVTITSTSPGAIYGTTTTISLGPGEPHAFGLYNDLIRLTTPDDTDHYLRFDPHGGTEVDEIPLRASACSGACTSALAAAISIGDSLPPTGVVPPADDWIEIYIDDTPSDSSNHYSFDVLRETLTPRPYAAATVIASPGGDGGVAVPPPTQECPGLVAATPLVNACAIATACFPSYDTTAAMSACLNYWNGQDEGKRDSFLFVSDCAGVQTSMPCLFSGHDCVPTCTVAPDGVSYVCDQVALACGGTSSDDCALEGLACDAGSGACVAPSPCAVPSRCVGDGVLYSLGSAGATANFWVDCTALGYKTCVNGTRIDTQTNHGNITQPIGPVCSN